MDGVVHLVRHGEVENPKGIIYGRLPGFNLSARGQKQARAAADHLAERNIAAVWSSPLERAKETATEIAARHGIDVVTDDRLLEADSALEGAGRTLADLFQAPRLWRSLINPWRPSWGESFSEIRARMLSAIEEAMASNAGKEVVIVAHQTPVIVARLSLEKSRRPPWIGLTACHTGSVTTIALESGRVTSVAYFAPRAEA